MLRKAFTLSVFLFLILLAVVNVFAASLVEEVDVAYQYNWYVSQLYKTEDIRGASNFSLITSSNFYGNLSFSEFQDMTAAESDVIARSRTAFLVFI